MCLYPIKAVKASSIDSQGEIIEKLYFSFVDSTDDQLENLFPSGYERLTLPCRSCVECQNEYSEECFSTISPKYSFLYTILIYPMGRIVTRSRIALAIQI